MMLSFGQYISENKLIEDKIENKIDFYILDEYTKSDINKYHKLLSSGIYRAVAVMADNIEHFKDFPCIKIALVNYPDLKLTKQHLRYEILKLVDVDEIEFPWSNTYLKWTLKDWRKILDHCNENGIKLRCMLEMGIQDISDIAKAIVYLKEIGIYSIMSSTGLIPEITTIDIWDNIKNEIPEIFEIKICGVLTEGDIKQFLESDADLVATTMELKFGQDIF